ncbi:LacI family DNA-binding transcriptional regulator [Brachybacterium hainanense]|uniref:LacI family DNA-binding transcriptional regulator n=1 Tax=Brachybacterium hainanense TaxID=1541174 RepID=A0ABV6RDD5_9MICO
MLDDRSPTVYDVARHAEVSIATVSRVLRHPDKVSETTRRRVLASVEELGYVPNASARGLAGRRTGVLGLLIPGHDIPTTSLREPVGEEGGTVAFLDDRDGRQADPYRNRYFEQLVRGAEAAAWKAGYALLVAAGTSVSRDVVVHDLAGRVDGLAAVARTVPEDLLLRSAGRTPLVTIAGEAGAGSDAVRADNRGGMAALVRHVLAVKPRGPVLYLAGPPDSPDAAAREAGFRDAVADRDVVWSALLGDFTWRAGHDVMAAHLAREVPAAVVAANDQSALGALAALRESGVEVPGTCVVTGFDGIDESRYATPTLTTVRQPMVDLGIRAIELLLRRLADPGADACELRLPVDVLLRQSCGPLP